MCVQGRSLHHMLNLNVCDTDKHNCSIRDARRYQKSKRLNLVCEFGATLHTWPPEHMEHLTDTYRFALFEVRPRFPPPEMAVGQKIGRKFRGFGGSCEGNSRHLIFSLIACSGWSRFKNMRLALSWITIATFLIHNGCGFVNGCMSPLANVWRRSVYFVSLMLSGARCTGERRLMLYIKCQICMRYQRCNISNESKVLFNSW